jgi:hypothetical protein
MTPKKTKIFNLFFKLRGDFNAFMRRIMANLGRFVKALEIQLTRQ